MRVIGKYKGHDVPPMATGGILRLEQADGQIKEILIDSNFLWAYFEGLILNRELEIECIELNDKLLATTMVEEV